MCVNRILKGVSDRGHSEKYILSYASIYDPFFLA